MKREELMRPLDKVADAVIKLTPPDFDKREEFVNDLNSVKTSFAYAAPEVHGSLWNRFVSSLDNYLGEPDTEWKKRIQSVVANKAGYQEILDSK